MGRLYSEFQAANAEVLVILGDSLEKARSYAEVLHLPFAVLADPERTVYHQYGLERAFLGLQRTASVLIDSGGTIRYLKRTVNTMQWLQESKEILAAAQAVAPARG